MRRQATLNAVIALLSFSAAYAAAVAPDQSLSTPTVHQSAVCNTGQQSGPFCCAAVCTQCGGQGCGANGNGDSCCTGRITASGRICGQDAPPCRIVPTTSAPATTTPPVADPTCSRGILNGEVCCPASCGSCGGPGCSSRGPGGSQCCYGVTQRAGILCSDAGPPCLVRSAPVTTQAPTTTTTQAPTTTTTQATTLGMTGPVGEVNRWVNIDNQLTGRPQARHEACFLMVNGKGYLLGGRGNRVVSILDPLAKTWTAGPPMVRMMHHMQCVSRGSRIYIAAAWEGRFPSETNLEDMHVFDTATLTWSTLPAMPANRRRGAAAVVINGDRMYVVAGNTGGHGPPSVSVGWFDFYDFNTGRWVTGTMPDIPGPRDHVLGGMVNGQLCVAGGRDGGQANFFGATVAESHCFNFGTGSWRPAGDIPTQRAGTNTATTCAGELMVVGGEGPSFAFRETELYDGQSWSSGPNLVRARHGSGLAVSRCSCGHIFTASGSGRRGGSPELTSTELYVPPGGATTCSGY